MNTIARNQGGIIWAHVVTCLRHPMIVSVLESAHLSVQKFGSWSWPTIKWSVSPNPQFTGSTWGLKSVRMICFNDWLIVWEEFGNGFITLYYILFYFFMYWNATKFSSCSFSTVRMFSFMIVNGSLWDFMIVNWTSLSFKQVVRAKQQTYTSWKYQSVSLHEKESSHLSCSLNSTSQCPFLSKSTILCMKEMGMYDVCPVGFTPQVQSGEILRELVEKLANSSASLDLPVGKVTLYFCSLMLSLTQHEQIWSLCATPWTTMPWLISDQWLSCLLARSLQEFMNL